MPYQKDLELRDAAGRRGHRGRGARARQALSGQNGLGRRRSTERTLIPRDAMRRAHGAEPLAVRGTSPTSRRASRRWRAAAPPEEDCALSIETKESLCRSGSATPRGARAASSSPRRASSAGRAGTGRARARAGVRSSERLEILADGAEPSRADVQAPRPRQGRRSSGRPRRRDPRRRAAGSGSSRRRGSGSLRPSRIQSKGISNTPSRSGPTNVFSRTTTASKAAAELGAEPLHSIFDSP